MQDATRTYSKKMEEDVARRLGGRVVANSGATLMYKGDVRTEDFLVECKTVMKPQKGVTIQKEWLTKIREEAFGAGKHYSAVAIRFEPDGKNFYVIDEPTMQELLEFIEEKRNEL